MVEGARWARVRLANEGIRKDLEVLSNKSNQYSAALGIAKDLY